MAQNGLKDLRFTGVQIRSSFWSVFSHIWTEYGDLWNKSLYSVQIWENTDQEKLCIWTLLTQKV